MDTSQPPSPVSKARKSSAKSDITNNLEIPPAISPLNSPDKTEEEDLHLTFFRNKRKRGQQSRQIFLPAISVSLSFEQKPKSFLFLMQGKRK